MQRLGKNINGYLGEGIDIESVLRGVRDSAAQHGWLNETFLQTARLALTALHRPAKSPPAARLYISAGIHGDEPAGPLAVRRLLRENKWPDALDIRLCPCLNPTGFELNRRENAQGTDLNRQYLHPQAAEVAAHVEWLRRQPGFDLTLCLHEDWESHGFYVYELNPDNRPSFAEAIVKRVADVCPIDPNQTIEGWPTERGVIRPGIDPRARPDWPEAFFLITHKTRQSYTLEAPSDFPLPTRVAALVAGVNAAAERLAEEFG